jgi:hypothetical protein
MRVWTVQPLAVWERLQHDGTVLVDEAAVGYVPEAYGWLARQLRERVPAYPGTLPWWVYREKPDLRWVRHRRPAGQREVRIELEPEAASFVSFPVWAWNTVYCRNYLAFTRKEHDGWIETMRRAIPDEDTWPLPEPWQAQLEMSWERLFDADLPALPWDPGAFGARGSREGVLGQLRLEEVRGVTHFVGCGKRQE